MNMMITEEEKKELLSKYSGDTSDELLTHLKRHFPVTEIKYDWMTEPVQFIQVDDKSRLIKNFIVIRFHQMLYFLMIKN